MTELTPFDQALITHGWQRPADFLRAFETTADVLGETVTITDRQLRRWRAPCHPPPVLEHGASSTRCSAGIRLTSVSLGPRRVSSWVGANPLEEGAVKWTVARS